MAERLAGLLARAYIGVLPDAKKTIQYVWP